MNSDLKHRVDTTLRGLSWRPEDSRVTLQIMKGETKMKKRLSFGMAVALVLLILTMAAAVAEIIRYSVRDYQNLESYAVERHITPIGQEMKTPHATMYLTDAVFDGQTLSVALEIQPSSDQPILLVPQLTAEAAGQAITPHVTASTGIDFRYGSWIPQNQDKQPQGKYGFAAVLPLQVQEDVVWTLRFHELKPLWPIVSDTSGYGDDTHGSADYDAWAAQFEDAYRNKQIMLVQGHSLMMFEALLPEGADLTQRLTESGAFEQTGQVEAQWTSPAIEAGPQADAQLIRGDGFEVKLEQLTLSFMKGSYRFALTITDPQTGPALWADDGSLMGYEISADGLDIRYTASSGGVDDTDGTGKSVVHSGEFLYTGEPPSSFTFRQYGYDQMGQIVYSDKGTFTVPFK